MMLDICRECLETGWRIVVDLGDPVELAAGKTICTSREPRGGGCFRRSLSNDMCAINVQGLGERGGDHYNLIK